MSKEEKQLLIEALKQVLKWHEGDDDFALYDEIEYYGLCSMKHNLTPLKAELYGSYLKYNLPPKRYTEKGFDDGWCWSTKSKAGRMNWLRKHIAKLEKEIS